MISIFIHRELQALLPTGYAFRADESDAPSGTLEAHKTHDPNANADANLEAFVRAHGVGTIVVSAGPWKTGAIVDGCRRFAIAKRLDLPYKVQAVSFADASEAKRYRWSCNVSVRRQVPYYLIVRSFLLDDDFKAHFKALATEGMKRMKEGGKRGGQRAGKKSEIKPFDRRGEAAKFCGVSPQQFFYARWVFTWEMSPTKFFPREYLEEAGRYFRKAHTGYHDAKSVYMHLKNMIKRLRRKTKLDVGAAKKNGKAAKGIATTYQKGQTNCVYHSDCVKLMAAMPSEEVDRVATSPPYFVPKMSYGEDYIGAKTWDEYCTFTQAWLAQAWRILKPHGILVVNVDNTTEDHEIAKANGRNMRLTHDHDRVIRNYVEALGCNHWQLKVWSKKNMAGKASARGSKEHPNSRPNYEFVMYFFKGWRPCDEIIPVCDDRELSEWSMNTWDILPENQKRHHPAPYPKELATRMVCYGASLTDVVLDPFSGTGTTLQAAAERGMKYIGIDIISSSAEDSKRAGDRGQRANERGANEVVKAGEQLRRNRAADF